MYNVMIVDDAEIARRRIRKLKIWGEESGFVIAEEASNGHEAMIKLQGTPVDLVITDIRMPKMDGIELLQRVRQHHPGIRVVLLSDFGDFTYAKQGFLSGALDYLTKPVDTEELAKLLYRTGQLIREEQAELSAAHTEEHPEEQEAEEEIRHVSKLLREGHLQLASFAEKAVDRIIALLSHDEITASRMIRKLTRETFRSAFRCYKWLPLFLDVRSLMEPHLASYDDFITLKTAYMQAVRRIAELLSKLHHIGSGSVAVDKICDCVLNHVDKEVSVRFLAEALFMNKTYVSEVFKDKTGIPLTEYMSMVKMERAKLLLEDDKLKIYEISDKLGFKDVEYFSRVFKKHTGQTPTNYRLGAQACVTL